MPEKALWLITFLFLIGIIFGFLTDSFSRDLKKRKVTRCEGFEIHTFENCRCFSRGEIIQQWKHFSSFRTTLTTVLALFIILLVTGQVGPPQWNWIRISILFVTGLALFYCEHSS